MGRVDCTHRPEQLQFIYVKKKQISDSKMAANDVLNGIILNIRKSNLNFNLNLTPFSAYITVRGSFVRNFVPNESFNQLTTKSFDSVKVNEFEKENRILSLKV